LILANTYVYSGTNLPVKMVGITIYSVQNRGLAKWKKADYIQKHLEYGRSQRHNTRRIQTYYGKQ